MILGTHTEEARVTVRPRLDEYSVPVFVSVNFLPYMDRDALVQTSIYDTGAYRASTRSVRTQDGVSAFGLQTRTPFGANRVYVESGRCARQREKFWVRAVRTNAFAQHIEWHTRQAVAFLEGWLSNAKKTT